MSPRLERWLPFILAGVAILAWVGPLQWVAGSVGQISDIPTYEGAYGHMAAGEFPYRDFSLEYPPLAALLFYVVGVLPGSYSFVFGAFMLLALVATVVAVTLTARALGMSPMRQVVAGGVVALSPLLLGNLLATRFDLVLAALIAWMLWAVVTDRMGLAWVILGAAVVVKLVPLAFIPVLIILHARRHGAASTLRAAMAGAAVVLVVTVPILIAAPSGLWATVSYHLDRPLQLESTGAAYLMGLRLLAGIPLAVDTSFGSQGLSGGGPDALALISSIVLVVLVAVIALRVARVLAASPPAADSAVFIAGIAATTVALLVAGKVLSPQFLVWLLPSVLLTTGRFGWASVVVSAIALLATQAYFPSLYWDLVALQGPQMGLLILRDAVLIVLLALVWPRRPAATTRQRGSPGGSVPARYLAG